MHVWFFWKTCLNKSAASIFAHFNMKPLNQGLLYPSAFSVSWNCSFKSIISNSNEWMMNKKSLLVREPRTLVLIFHVSFLYAHAPWRQHWRDACSAERVLASARHNSLYNVPAAQILESAREHSLSWIGISHLRRNFCC